MKGNSPLFGTNRKRISDSMSRTQRKTIERADRTIDDHLTIRDFEGAIRDLQGNPIPKGNTGEYFNHYDEVSKGIRGIEKAIESLENSLQNPNLPTNDRNIIEERVKEYKSYINRWKDIKEEYGKK